jgi:hypothetical protein
MAIGREAHCFIVSDRLPVLLANEGLDHRHAGLAGRRQRHPEQLRSNPSARGRWADVRADDPPPDRRVIGISLASVLQGLEAENVAVVVDPNRSLYLVRMIDVVRAHEMRIVGSRSLPGDDKLLKDVAQRLGIGRLCCAHSH